MNRVYFGVICFVLLMLLGCSSDSNLAAFKDQRWQNQQWQVIVNGNWYELKSIDNEPVEKIIKKLKSVDYEWRRNLLTDFKNTIESTGLEIGNTIEVVLITPSGQLMTMDVDLSKEKFRHSALMADTYPIAFNSKPEANNYTCDAQKVNLVNISEEKVNVEQAKAYLNKIEGLVDNVYAYKDRTSFNYHEEFYCLRISLNENISTLYFQMQVTELLSQFGDGHLRVLSRYGDDQFLPFLVFHTEYGYIALHEDRDRMIDSNHPYIKSIDGKPISFWIKKSTSFATKGSQQLNSISSVKNLRYLPMLRRKADMIMQDTLDVELRNKKGDSVINKKLSLSDEVIKYGGWPYKKTELLDNNIGYLRIAKMSKESDFIDEAMHSFKDTQGLIIDVRGNGGGRRTILKALMPYFLDENELYISNLAKYRITALDDKASKEGYLKDRYLFPASSSLFDKSERKIINEFISEFRPNKQVESESFSDWHVMVHRIQDNPKSYYYKKPVIILMDSMNFSATDIFLNAMKGRKNISLIGQASGGGSGRSRYYFLPGLQEEAISGMVIMPTMISYKTNGDLVEGVGVQPDLFMKYSIADLTGESDSILEKAQATLAETMEK